MQVQKVKKGKMVKKERQVQEEIKVQKENHQQLLVIKEIRVKREE